VKSLIKILKIAFANTMQKHSMDPSALDKCDFLESHYEDRIDFSYDDTYQNSKRYMVLIPVKFKKNKPMYHICFLRNLEHPIDIRDKTIYDHNTRLDDTTFKVLYYEITNDMKTYFDKVMQEYNGDPLLSKPSMIEPFKIPDDQREFVVFKCSYGKYYSGDDVMTTFEGKESRSWNARKLFKLFNDSKLKKYFTYTYKLHLELYSPVVSQFTKYPVFDIDKIDITFNTQQIRKNLCENKARESLHVFIEVVAIHEIELPQELWDHILSYIIDYHEIEEKKNLKTILGIPLE
jgi:hypothetical protein